MLAYLTSLGVVPMFAARAFVPLFATALVARIGPEFAPFAGSLGIDLFGNLPDWATSNVTLAILGIMALVEVVMAKVPEARELMIYTSAQLKGIAAFLACFLMLGGSPLELLEHVRKEGFATEYAWGQSFVYTWSFGLGAIVWFTSALHRRIHAWLRDVDEDDSLGLQKLLSYLEDSIGFLGVLFLLNSLLALATAGATIGGLYLVRRMLEAREERRKVPCESCGTPNHLCGVRCSSCERPLPNPRRVGLLGSARDEAVQDFALHRLEMVAQKRCPTCGDRLKQRRVDQICPKCDTRPFEDAKAFEEFLASVRARLPHTMAVSFGLGLIPLAGLIPGILYYRVCLISNLMHYVPRSRSFFTRWLVRLVNGTLLCLQPVPVVGAFTLPLMCLTNYSVYRSTLRRQGTKALAAV
jgi:hypothetical protein